MKRHGRYLAIREYAAIGDGRAIALIGRDGAVDWLCLPDVDSPSVFGAVLDAQQGGSFALAPEAPFTARRRYLPQSNVLETTFTTAEGVVRVTDAMSVSGEGLAPQRELVRRIEGLAGRVPMRWRVEPRFGYGQRRVRTGRRAGVPVASAGADAVAVCSWDAGPPRLDDGALVGHLTTSLGSRALIALAAAHAEPLVIPSRAEAEARVDRT